MGTLSVPEVGEAVTGSDPKIKSAIEAVNAVFGTENKIKGSGVEAGTIESSSIKNETILTEDLALSARPFRWYTPVEIATEQTRENVAFGTLTTPDEIKEVVLPKNGLLAIGYRALVKSSVANEGRTAIFIGGTQLKLSGPTTPEGQEVATSGTPFHVVTSSHAGLQGSNIGTSFVTTGQILTATTSGAVYHGGLCYVFAAAGTYNISVQFKALSGNIVAKERVLQVATLGV